MHLPDPLHSAPSPTQPNLYPEPQLNPSRSYPLALPANELNSFTARGGGKLALPRLLRLKPEDVILTGGKPFRHGRFTWVTENGRQERWIVASCGNHSVVWNMRRWVRTHAHTSGCRVGGLV